MAAPVEGRANMDAIESLDWLSAISHNPLMITLIASSIQKGKKVMTITHATLYLHSYCAPCQFKVKI